MPERYLPPSVEPLKTLRLRCSQYVTSVSEASVTAHGCEWQRAFPAARARTVV